jgi:DNA-binding response OmpR family regulator
MTIRPTTASRQARRRGDPGAGSLRDTRGGPTQPLRVAVIDHEVRIADELARHSAPLEWEVRLIDRPTSIPALIAMRLNALVLDIAALRRLARTKDPWRWLEELAGTLPQLAILVCTASATVAERVQGLQLGADDWLTKSSCHPEELVARIQRATTSRRPALPPEQSEPITTGELHIRFDHQQAFVDGLSAQLTLREFEILTLLAAKPEIVFERSEIYSRLWGYTLAPGDRSVDVFIGKLRVKLKRVSPRWDYLHTHFGIGYRFAAQEVREDDRTRQSGGSSVAVTPK